MFNSIKDYASSALGTAVQRVTNPAFGAFSLSWCAFNWKQILYLFLSNTPILDKITYMTSTSNWKTVIGYPVISTIVLCGFLPWVNYLITTWQIKPLDHTDSIDNQRKAKTIRRSTRLQRLQAKHDVTYDKVKTGAEKDIQSMKEQIALSQDRMGELTAELTVKSDELRQSLIKINDVEAVLKTTQDLMRKLNSDKQSLEDKYQELNVEFSNYRSQYAIANGDHLSSGLDAFGTSGRMAKQIISLNGVNIDGVRGAISPNKTD